MVSEKRQVLVETATALFSEHGFQAVGVDWIIRDSGVVRMTLYRHFTGKDELVREVLSQRHTHIFQSIEQKMRHIADPKERLKSIFTWYQSWFCTPEFAGCLFERALAEFGTKRPLISETAVNFRNSMTDLIVDILREIVPASSAKHLAQIFMMLLDGATVEARATNSSHSAAAAWASAEKLLQYETSKNSTVSSSGRSGRPRRAKKRTARKTLKSKA
jgi:AcrR family transcriptional regulator